MSRLVVAIGHVEFTIAGQTLYVVHVQQDADEWDVRRTYSDFRKLREDVARVMRENRAIDACSQEFASAANSLAFPAKKLFGSRRDRVVRERAVELHQFLIRLLLLTHTYRKAQKQLYDPQGSSGASAHLVPPQQQASANVFYLLRDFLKPLGATTGISQTMEDESDESARRMIRESKMLSMRSSGHHQSAVPKAMSAPNVLAHVSNDTTASAQAQHTSDQFQPQQQQQQQNNAFAHAKSTAALYRKQNTIPILEEAPPPTNNYSSSKKTLNIAAFMSRSARTDSNSSDRSNPLALGSSFAADDSRARNVSNASSSHYSTTSSRKHSTASNASDTQQPVVLSSVQQGRKVSSASANSSHASSSVAIAAPPSSSNVSSSSSAMYVHGSAPSSTSSSGAASRAYPPSNSSNTSSSMSSQQRQQLAFYDSDDHAPKKNLRSSAHTVERRSKNHNTSSSSTSSSHKKSGLSSTSSTTRSKTRSSSARDIRTSERKSKLSPQLTAQAVTINAQKELERYLSEYSAIMILRYVDRFISKAVTKAPGCYTVNAQRRLVIDSERFLEELEETFKDLPANFEGNFRNPYANGDWFFPAALDAYVQMKWNSFQGNSVPSSSSSKYSGGGSKSKNAKSSGRGRRASDSEDDSEDSDSEYETIGGGGGYMKAKKIFTDEEADVLDKMIADGTAGRDQMLRLRRQMNEVGWNRRAHPSGSSATLSVSSASSKSRKKKTQTEYWTDTDDDETRQTGSSGGEEQTSVEHYQQKYNALRKERLSRRAAGGLV